MRILLVESSDGVCDLVMRFLARSGHRVVGRATTPEEAVGLFAELRPDVCAVDVGPGCTTGLDALRGILDLDPRARVIACTNAGFGVNTMAAVRAGATHVVTSLVRLEEVLAELGARDGIGAGSGMEVEVFVAR